MNNALPYVRTLLIAALAFLAFTAVAGGLGLVTGALEVPAELLAGSIFPDYRVPGLALLLVGGGSTLAARWVGRKDPRGAPAAIVSGAMILVFELVEILVIGTDEGAAAVLQTFYIGLGTLILLLAAALLRFRRAEVLGAGAGPASALDPDPRLAPDRDRVPTPTPDPDRGDRRP